MYIFKHALIHEAPTRAVAAKRQDYHLRVAATFKDFFPEVTTNRPELLAHSTTQRRPGFAEAVA